MIWKAAMDRVLVTPVKGKKQTDGGIVLPDHMKADLYEGTVLTAGPDAHGVMPGDTVFYTASKYLVNVTSGEATAVSITADSIVAIQRGE